MDKKTKNGLKLALPLAVAVTFPVMATAASNATAGFLCAILSIYLSSFVIDIAVIEAKRGNL